MGLLGFSQRTDKGLTREISAKGRTRYLDLYQASPNDYSKNPVDLGQHNPLKYNHV
jgi:hypothetical protein